MSFTKESARRAALIGAAKYHRPFRDRLLEKIQMKRHGCWPWKAATHQFGYGVINIGHKKGNIFAHRAMWIEHNGPVPVGLFVLHRCDNPPCCNPDHLFLGTQHDNIHDMIKKGRAKHSKGVEHPRAKLNDEKVGQIRVMAEAGWTHSRMAVSFDVSKSAISHACQRRKWKHVL